MSMHGPPGGLQLSCDILWCVVVVCLPGHYVELAVGHVEHQNIPGPEYGCSLVDGDTPDERAKSQQPREENTVACQQEQR